MRGRNERDVEEAREALLDYLHVEHLRCKVRFDMLTFQNPEIGKRSDALQERIIKLGRRVAELRETIAMLEPEEEKIAVM